MCCRLLRVVMHSSGTGGDWLGRLSLALFVAASGCADVGCPEGTVLNQDTDTCVRPVADASVDVGDAEDSSTELRDGEIDLESADLGACGRLCAGETPYCNELASECVECVSHGDCGGTTPFCGAGACVECRGHSDCGGATPICEQGICTACSVRAECTTQPTHPACNPVTGACVACDAANEASDCGDTPSTPRCNATQECVQCRGGTATLDCTSPTASRCSGGACVGCQSSAQCAHVPGRPNCVSGTCV